MEWQPIETAPKDGTRVVLFFPGPFRDKTETGMVTGQWSRDGWWLTAIWASAGAGSKEATHWMPLPEPPK